MDFFVIFAYGYKEMVSEKVNKLSNHTTHNLLDARHVGAARLELQRKEHQLVLGEEVRSAVHQVGQRGNLWPLLELLQRLVVLVFQGRHLLEKSPVGNNVFLRYRQQTTEKGKIQEDDGV